MATLVVDAIYENGVLKLANLLPLKEHEKVQVTINTTTPLSAVDLVRATYGMLGWTGDAETVERVALDPEFGIRESP